MRIIRQCFIQLGDSWEAVQVELHGQYSVPRLRALRYYCEQTSLLRAFAVTLLTPIPCLLIIIGVDMLPLVSPDEGLAKQTTGFWFRLYFLCWLLTFSFLGQISKVMPMLPLSTRRLLCISFAIPVPIITILYAYFRSVGFPGPFAIQVETPPWIAMLGTALWFSWRDTLRDNPKVRDDLIRYLKVFQAQVVIVLVYTAFNVTFTRIGRSYQTAFSMLLPPIKIIFKNWVSAGLAHLEDLVPIIVVFNVDVFHALFVSLTMQQSVTGGSMAVVMGVDVVQSLIAYYEIRKVLMVVHASVAKLRLRGEVEVANIDFFQLAADILEGNERIREHPDIVKARHIFTGTRQQSSASSNSNTRYFGDRNSQVRPRDLQVVPSSCAVPGRTMVVPHASANTQVLSSPPVTTVQGDSPSNVGISAIVAAPDAPHPASTQLTNLENQQLVCVQNVLKLLHMTEFYVLVEFAEVMMAALYGA